jgi:hypothetical protein
LVKRAHYFTSQNLWRKKSPIPCGVTMAQGPQARRCRRR